MTQGAPQDATTGRDAPRVSLPARAAPAWPLGGRGRSGQVMSSNLPAMAIGFEALTAAFMLLDSRGRLLFANSRAAELLRRGDVVTLDAGGGLRCCDGKAQRHLQSLIMAAGNEAGHQDGAGMRMLALPRRDGWPLGALVGGAPDGPADDGHTGGTIVVLIRDPDQATQGFAERIAEVFALTGAEAQVAAALAAGANLYEIAARRGVSLATVRNQVKSVQAKTGVLRQAELVSLILRTVQF